MLKIIHGEKFAKKLGDARKKFEQEIELLGKVRQYRNSALYTVTEVKEKDNELPTAEAVGFGIVG